VAELFGSDVTLIGATLAGLALTLLAIFHDIGRFDLSRQHIPKAAALGGAP